MAASEDLEAAYDGLFMAAEHGRADVLKALLEHGKDVLDLPQIRNAAGLTPLHVAVIFQKADAVRTLLAAGFPADAQVIGSANPKYAGLTAFALAANQAPARSILQVFLQFAIQEVAANNVESVASIIRAGADPITATDGSPLENSLLHWAACSNAVDVAVLLLDHVTDENQRAVLINRRNADGATALHDACYGNHAACVQLLVDRGADLSIVGTSGYFKDKTAVEVSSSNDIMQIIAKARLQPASALSSPSVDACLRHDIEQNFAEATSSNVVEPVLPSPPRSNTEKQTDTQFRGDHTSVLLEEKQALIEELKHTIDGLVTESHDRQLLREQEVVLEFIRKLREEKQVVERHLQDAEQHIVAQEEIMMELKTHIRRHNALDLKQEIRTLQHEKAMANAHLRNANTATVEDLVVTVTATTDDEPPHSNRSNSSTTSGRSITFRSMSATTELDVPLPSPKTPPTPSFWTSLLYYLWPFTDEEALPSMNSTDRVAIDQTIMTV
ncbi:hypothetical protein DYB32_006924 [Aphanomyces invadans]|uniref:Uncharacterized protein n=1 Tax=Aphanomyces invadans TaxID=157072 RepID=A0A3R6WIR2_9STRA|nr:hypothetical protein DYB32_006924 [Aphanomyces invadans]